VLVAAAVGVPLLLALGWWMPGLRRWVTALAPLAALPAAVLAGVHLVGMRAARRAAEAAGLPVAPGHGAAGGVDPGLSLEVPLLFLNLRLGVDLAGGALLVLTALLWVAGGLFARSSRADDPRREVFFAFFLATLAGNVGLVLAADLLTFYLFFALMTFAGWGLVVHARSEAAVRAGRVYLVLALLGEVAILWALFSLGAAGGAGFTASGFVEAGNPLALVPGEGLAASWDALGDSAPWVALLALFGLGVKAGLLPVHLWLPLAHPVAPTAASALLSGVMIKAGVLGWLRIFPEASLAPGAEVGAVAGAVLLAMGAVGALWGVVCGLAQDDPKTILAYSSISQVGYLAMGAGLLVMAGPGTEVGLLALGAVLVYAVHHGVAKAALFLSVGVASHIPIRPRPPGAIPGDLGARLREESAWRWVLRAGVALPALALAGLPLTSGAVAKGLLKEALGTLGGRWYSVLDPLLLVAAAGTTLLLVRFVVRLEAKVEDRLQQSTGSSSLSPSSPPWGQILPWGALVGVGALAPLWLLPAVLGGAFLPPGVPLPAAWGGSAGDALALVLPVVVGLGVGGVVLVRVLAGPGLPGGVHRIRIPAGDLLAPMAWLLARRPRATRGLATLTQASRERLLDLESRVVDFHARLVRKDLVLMRGPVLGLVLVLLLLALALAWAQGG
jgi:hydrogenase-4 component B